MRDTTRSDWTLVTCRVLTNSFYTIIVHRGEQIPNLTPGKPAKPVTEKFWTLGVRGSTSQSGAVQTTDNNLHSRRQKNGVSRMKLASSRRRMSVEAGETLKVTGPVPEPIEWDVVPSQPGQQGVSEIMKHQLPVPDRPDRSSAACRRLHCFFHLQCDLCHDVGWDGYPGTTPSKASLDLRGRLGAKETGVFVLHLQWSSLRGQQHVCLFSDEHCISIFRSFA
ncbi:hypothetical protein CONLIGDRAFT_630605 [Coniochaeta ligniaria NRRL 30616]|uniref:Uncharacterized protein n=1 Tax=Coniochaeta ligniaria NRRL 30616 TaxID=1408157 RepID=A0A1J7ITZ4_9PEZI|nr:hypothetical protein CONLIGDRAFT_630605 [Coniochaeta ligniaria NRRL 30616]